MISSAPSRTSCPRSWGAISATACTIYSTTPAPGVLSPGTTAGYFSIDGGQTALNNFNPGSGDGDWAGNTVDAYNAYATPGVVLPVSNNDLIAMDVLGWNSTGTTTYSGDDFDLDADYGPIGKSAPARLTRRGSHPVGVL